MKDNLDLLTIEKAIMCDDIMQLFHGDRSISKKELIENKSIHESIYVIENHLKFLEADKAIDVTMNTGELLYHLTQRGWYIQSEKSTAGYEARKREQMEQSELDRKVYHIAESSHSIAVKSYSLSQKSYWWLIVATVLAAITLGTTFRSCSTP